MYALRKFVRLAIAIVIVSLLPFASPSSAQELKIAVAADVTSADPHFFNLFPNNNIAEHIFDKLVQMDPDSKMIPGLATSWKTVDDKTWEFKLRKGVKFHDGSELTAEDVVFSIDRVPNVPNSPGPFTAYTKAIIRWRPTISRRFTSCRKESLPARAPKISTPAKRPSAAAATSWFATFPAIASSWCVTTITGARNRRGRK